MTSMKSLRNHLQKSKLELKIKVNEYNLDKQMPIFFLWHALEIKKKQNKKKKKANESLLPTDFLTLFL